MSESARRAAVCGNGMRCVACGVEMRIVRKVPDQSMMVTGDELRTFECPSCRSRQARLVFTRSMEQLPTERMHLPSAFPTLRASTKHKVSVAARTAWARALLMFRGRSAGGS
jgi:hypothetical protein